MNIKKSLLLLLTIVFVLSCNQDEIFDQTNGQTAGLTADISQYDESNLGLYKGTFTTLDATERGIVEVTILNNLPSRATLTLVSGNTYQLKSTTNVINGQTVADLRFVTVSDYQNAVAFNFSVEENGDNPRISNVSLGENSSSVIIAKETSRAPVVPITGTYLCIECGTHPNLGSTTQTFNMVYSGDGSGADSMTTDITLDTTVFNSTANTQGACVANGSFNDCPISGQTLVGTSPIDWTGTHSYDTVGDCSQVSGTWTYTSAVYGALSGEFISDSQCLPPVNDLCGDAIAISCGSVETATTSAATETGEPTTWCVETDPLGPGIWYIYTSTGNGDNVIVDTCGSNYDTKLFVYTDGCGTLTCLTGNDDSCGLQSEVTFNEGTTAGVEFLVYAAGFNGATGSFILNVNCETPPPPFPNDECANAVVIDCATSFIDLDMSASTNTGNPTDSCAVGTGDIPGTGSGAWYTFTDTGAGDEITIDLSGSDFDTKLHVYTGSCGTFTCIASDDDGGTGTASLLKFLEVGDGTTVYYVLVTRFGTATAGNLDLAVSCAPPPPPPGVCSGSNIPYVAAGVPATITDDSCALVAETIVPITISQTGILGTDYDIDNVELSIDFSWAGSVEISIESPLGTQLFLAGSNGGSASGSVYVNTQFKDGGADINGGSVPYTALFAPEGGTFAAAFDGEQVNGTWNLIVCDNDALGDSGEVVQFDINLCDGTLSFTDPVDRQASSVKVKRNDVSRQEYMLKEKK